MTFLGASLQLHKWIALVVGLQVLFWTAGGLVMTAIPIERVRSEHHLAKTRPAPLPLAKTLAAEEAVRRSGIASATSVQLKTTPRGPLWIVSAAEGAPRVVDAITGVRLQGMREQEAKAIAAKAYVGSGRPHAARFYEKAPNETGREGPLWRVDFNDTERTSFYVAPDTGEVVTRRSNVWRFYDFFWRLHILDFADGDDFNHPLLIGLAALTLPVVLTGFVLLWIRLARDWKTTRARRRKLKAAAG
jgi:uncharacterized iron-regulated membrane protein